MDILNSFDEFFGYASIALILWVGHVRSPQDAGCSLVVYALVIAGIKARAQSGLNENIGTLLDFKEDEEVISTLKSARHRDKKIKR